MLFMRKLDKGKNAKALAKTVVRMLISYKAYIKTITTDNGAEFACHEMISSPRRSRVI
jgi:IS30 family transposase